MDIKDKLKEKVNINELLDKINEFGTTGLTEVERNQLTLFANADEVIETINVIADILNELEEKVEEIIKKYKITNSTPPTNFNDMLEQMLNLSVNVRKADEEYIQLIAPYDKKIDGYNKILLKYGLSIKDEDIYDILKEKAPIVEKILKR